MSFTMATTDGRCSVKVLVAADVHLRRRKLEALEAAVLKERPEVVALNGDLLDVGTTYRHQVGARDCAALLSGLPPCEIVIVGETTRTRTGSISSPPGHSGPSGSRCCTAPAPNTVR